MIAELIRMSRLPKKELEQISMTWFNWLDASVSSKTIQLPRESKKYIGKARKSEMRYFTEKIKSPDGS